MRPRRVAGPCGLVVLVLLAGCSSSPVLVEDSALDGATSVHQDDEKALAPGWTWCDEIAPGLYVRGDVVSSWFGFGERGSAGATVIDRSADGLSAASVLELIEQRAASCAASDLTERGNSIEPLTGLGDGEAGWRTTTADGERGEYVLVPLDDRRLLAVGVATTEDEAPVDLDELVALATRGGERVAGSEG